MAGDERMPNLKHGVALFAPNNTIENNLISGNNGWAIFTRFSFGGGNLIRLDADASAIEAQPAELLSQPDIVEHFGETIMQMQPDIRDNDKVQELVCKYLSS